MIAGTNNEFTIKHDNTNTIIDNTVGILDIKSQQVAISTHLSVGGIVTVSTPSASKGARNISISTEAPSGGSDGDLWFTYIA